MKYYEILLASGSWCALLGVIGIILGNKPIEQESLIFMGIINILIGIAIIFFKKFKSKDKTLPTKERKR